MVDPKWMNALGVEVERERLNHSLAGMGMDEDVLAEAMDAASRVLQARGAAALVSQLEVTMIPESRRESNAGCIGFRLICQPITVCEGGICRTITRCTRECIPAETA